MNPALSRRRRAAALFSGMVLGFVAGNAFVAVWHWLDLPPWDHDPKALGQILICSLAGLIGGGIVGAIWLVRLPRPALAVTAAVAALALAVLYALLFELV